MAPEHRHLLWSVFSHEGRVVAAQHNAMPFGCVASVYDWDRVGSLLCHLARVLIMLPASRYVDDFFSADRSASVEHAAQCFARLVRALLGHDAISEKKLGFGSPLTILGLSVSASGPNASRLYSTQAFSPQAARPNLQGDYRGRLSIRLGDSVEQ